jgi:hypothetical protein
MRPAVTIALVLAALSHCNGQIQSFEWLIGTWKSPASAAYERWEKAPDGEHLLGKAFLLEGPDTTVTETITLKHANGSFHYIPDVAGGQPPVDFRITTTNGHSFVAENPQHDFPKTIRYRLVRREGRDILEAQIEGNGKVTAYTFEKVK